MLRRMTIAALSALAAFGAMAAAIDFGDVPDNTPLLDAADPFGFGYKFTINGVDYYWTNQPSITVSATPVTLTVNGVAGSTATNSAWTITAASIGAATLAQIAALSNTVAAGADRIVTPDGTEFRDATGGVWRVYAPTNWYFAHNLPPVSTTLVSSLSYPLPENANFTFDWGLGEEEPGTVDILTDLPAYDRYVTVTYPYSLSLMGNADPMTGFVLADGASTATLYRAVGSALVTQRVDTVALVSDLPEAGVSAPVVTNIAVAAAAAATNGLSAGAAATTYTTATSAVIPVASAGTLYVDLTDWPATSSTWAASASWVVQPQFTVTGRYEFAFSELSTGVYRGRQVWPQCVACMARDEAPFVLGTSSGSSAFTFSFQTLIAAANTNGTMFFRTADPSVPYIARIGFYAAAGASATNTLSAYHGLFVTGLAEYTSTNLAFTSAASSGASAQRWLSKWFSVPAASEITAIDESSGVRQALHIRRFNATAGDVQVYGLDIRPMNELERAAYNAGWRP